MTKGYVTLHRVGDLVIVRRFTLGRVVEVGSVTVEEVAGRVWELGGGAE